MTSTIIVCIGLAALIVLSEIVYRIPNRNTK